MRERKMKDKEGKNIREKEEEKMNKKIGTW